MESLILNIESKNQVSDYIANHHLMPYEAGIFKEMLDAIAIEDQSQLNWFRSFGDSFRTITMNVYAYRKGLEFGFTEISFDKYDWFKRPEFLDKEELTFGDTSRYGNHSLIYLGRGVNHTWTYGMNYSFGVAGGCYGLSVYGKQFKSRQKNKFFDDLPKTVKLSTEKWLYILPNKGEGYLLYDPINEKEMGHPHA